MSNELEGYVQGRCRLEDGKCLEHGCETTICDLGLAELQAELKRAQDDYSFASHALRKADDSEMVVGCLERENTELRATIEEQARVIANVYSLMRRYDGTVGAVSPLRTFLTELDKTLSPTEPKEA